MCQEGHVWRTTYHSVLTGTWCPRCSHRKYTIEDSRQLALSRNGTFLSEKYIDTETVYLWECEKGHTWEASHRIVLDGGWCSRCKSSFGEARLQTIINNLGYEFVHQYKFDDFRGKNGNPYAYDFFLPQLNVLVEYDGSQHFRLVEYFNGAEGLQGRILNDFIKGEYCYSNNITLIRLAFDDHLETRLIELIDRMQTSGNFVMYPLLPTKYEGIVEALFSDTERYKITKIV